MYSWSAAKFRFLLYMSELNGLTPSTVTLSLSDSTCFVFAFVGMSVCGLTAIFTGQGMLGEG